MVVPDGVRAFERAVEGILKGHPRSVKLDAALSPYESIRFLKPT
jgi:hypothetical protein